MDEFSAIRNYQRIFKPDRRVYSWDGKPIPVPGGVPLWWLLYFAGTVITVIVLTSGSLLLGVLFAVVAGLCGLYIGNAASAAVAAIGAFLLVPVVGGALSQIDWPLRLLIVPGALATLAIQVALYSGLIVTGVLSAVAVAAVIWTLVPETVLEHWAG